MDTTVDARGLRALRIDADVGDVTVRATDGDSVRIAVVLRSSDADRLARECIPKSSLETALDAGILTAHVTQRTRNQCGARWDVAVPPRLRAVVTARVGDIVIEGLTGGIEASASKGNVDVRTRGEGHGTVRLSADVGRVRACVGGYDVPPTSHRGAGATLELRRPTGAEITLRAGVGNATLRLDGEAASERCGGEPTR
jgi:hypothetical protein